MLPKLDLRCARIAPHSLAHLMQQKKFSFCVFFFAKWASLAVRSCLFVLSGKSSPYCSMWTMVLHECTPSAQTWQRPQSAVLGMLATQPLGSGGNSTCRIQLSGGVEKVLLRFCAASDTGLAASHTMMTGREHLSVRQNYLSHGAFCHTTCGIHSNKDITSGRRESDYTVFRFSSVRFGF